MRTIPSNRCISIGHMFNYYFFKNLKGVTLCCVLLLYLTSIGIAQVTASFNANTNSGCYPLTVQFTNQSQNASTYYWDFGNGITSVVANPVITYNNTGNFTVKLVAHSSNGSDSLIIQNYINVFSKPVVQFTTANTAICQGFSVQFQNQTSPFDSCLWDFGDGVTSSVNNPSHTYLSAGVFSVTLIAYKAGSGCTSTLVKQNYITVTAQPLVSVTVDTNTACFTSKVFHFTASSSAAGSCQWNFGDGITATGNSSQHTYSQPGVYSVTLTIATTSGCTFNYTYSNYITVLNTPLPVISVTDSIGCHPLHTVFSTSSVGVSNLFWNFGNATSGTQSQMWGVYNQPGVYPVTVTVTYPNGCTATSQVKNIVVNQTPVSTFTTNTSAGCKPLGIQFTQPAAPNTTYNWQFGDGDSSTLQNPFHVYTDNGNTYPSLTANSSNGCSSTFIMPSGIAVHGFKVDFLADKTTGCNPLTVNFNNLTPGTTQWHWNFGNGNTSSLFSPQYIYQQQGTYAVQLICSDAYGCTDTLKKTSYIHVGASTNNFANGTPVTACAPFTVNLSDSSSSSSWLWDFNDGNTSTLQNPTHTFTVPGTYVVSLQTQSNNNSCSQLITNFRTYIIGGGTAAFTYTQTNCPPYIGYFTDSSANAVAWNWNFGDGSTSTQQNPTHTYASSGSYHVSLTVTTADGCTSTTTHQYAMSFEMLGGNATAQCTDTIAPFDVQFHANSQGATSWLWTFGDGDSSSLENPLHSYANLGPFTITLTVANDSCNHTYSFPPTNFGSGGSELDGSSDTIVHSMNYDGCVPLTLNFHNPFLNAVAWHWDFGDGHTSSDENPENIFEHPGIFDVMLWVTYADGSMDTIYTPAAVKVAGATGNFNVTSTNTCSGVTIQLQTDTMAIQSFDWDFGDGTTSNLPNPIHTYTGTSNYVISLNILDTMGCTSSVSSTFYADYSSPIQLNKTRACAYDSVLFSVASINYSQYLWHFGDGDSALGISVYHAYSDSGIYNVSLTVTDATGCENIFNFPSNIEINKPVADFTISTPVSNCNWVYLEFTNQSTGSILYNWNLGDGTTSSQTNISKYYYYSLPHGYYDVSLTASKNGCSSTKTIPNAVYIPDFYADFSYTRTNGCLPVTILPVDSSNDVAKWEWQFGDGDTSFIRNPSHTYISAPLSKIKLIATDINGCEKIIEKDNITLPEAKFITSDSAGCTPFNVMFTDDSENAMTWNWNFGDGTISSLQSPQHTYSSNGIFHPEVIVTDSFGCTDTMHVDSLISVTSPTVNFSMTNSGGCAPVIADFQNLSVGTQTYLWNFGDSSISSQENPTHIYSTPGNYSVTLTGTDAAGCSGTKTLNNVFTVPGPIAKFSFASTTGCAPLTISFSDSSVNALNYFWSFSDGDSSKLASPVHTYSQAGVYQVTLIVNDVNGCESIYTDPNLITVNTTPHADFSISDSIVCANVPVTFTNKTTSATSYKWDFGDGNTSTSLHPKHPYSAPGTYTVRLLATNTGCVDSLIMSNVIHVVTTPIAAFTADITEGCDPLTVSFQNQTTHVSNTSYFWDFGNGNQTWAANPAQVFNAPGYFTITLIAINEGVCADTTSKTNFIHVKNSDPIAAPKINYATVLNDSSIRVQWQNSTALNIGRYELYRAESTGGVYKPVYVDINPNNSTFNPVTTFIDSAVDASSQPYWYKVKVVNNCDNAFSLDSSDAHATMYLKTNADTGAVSLNWTPYEGCEFDTYHIYRSEDGNSFDLIGETASSEHNYLDSAAYCSHQYSYRIEASDLCNTVHFSESNTSTATPVSILETQTTSITRTTVEDNSYTLTEWVAPTSYPEMVTHYFLYRSATADSGKYNLLATFGPTATSYQDFDVDVQNQNYQYKIEVENICGVRGDLSDFAKTILLKGELNSMEGSTLKWSPYEGWKEGVDYYEIQQLDQNGVWQTIRKVNGNVNQMDDN